MNLTTTQLALIVLGLVQVTTLVLAGVGIATAGPTRWVKIVTLLALLTMAAWMTVWFGPVALAFVCGVPVFCLSAGTIATVHGWRTPYELHYEDAEVEECPDYAVETLDRWTAELRALGFSTFKNVTSPWLYMNEQRMSFTRFLSHPDHRVYASVSALSDPRSMQRAFVTVFEDGSSLVTSDVPTDAEIFTDPLSRVEHMSRTTDCARSLAQHLDSVARRTKEGAEPRRVEDPVAMNVEKRAAWMARLLESRQLARQGEWVSMPFRSVPGLLVAMLRHWFQ